MFAPSLVDFQHGRLLQQMQLNSRCDSFEFGGSNSAMAHEVGVSICYGLLALVSSDAVYKYMPAMQQVLGQREGYALTVHMLENRLAMEDGWSPVYVLGAGITEPFAAVCSASFMAPGVPPVAYFPGFMRSYTSRALLACLPPEVRQVAVARLAEVTAPPRIGPLFLASPQLHYTDHDFRHLDPRSAKAFTKFVGEHPTKYAELNGRIRHLHKFRGWTHGADAEPGLRNQLKMTCLDEQPPHTPTF